MLLLCPFGMKAQKFFNLTADEVRIGEQLPCFTYSQKLGTQYADSTYSVAIEYPEYMEMEKADIARLKSVWQGALPQEPVVNSRVVVERKSGILEVYFNPIVYRDGKYQKLVSFMLRVKAAAKAQGIMRANSNTEASKADRYAKNSVLAKGRWAKIRVPSSGVYSLSDAFIKRAGFTDPGKVKVYGYGGALHSEELNGQDIMKYDDLKEVPTCSYGGKRLFYAVGTVTWSDPEELTRTRNPYSDYGYYFLTQGDDAPATVDSTAFVSSFYPSNDDYHALHEVDNFAWGQGGRNLFESAPINVGATGSYTITVPAGVTSAYMKVALTASSETTAQISVNDSVVGRISMSKGGTYDMGVGNSDIYRNINNLQPSNTIKIKNLGSNIIRLDYIAMTFRDGIRPAPNLKDGTFPEPEYLYNITNQNHHADKACDMIIIIPTSQKLRQQAERLKEYHEKHDKMSVRIVPADELYNEFSSGTPEADAYRLYLKMFYDRAETESDMPKYLVLFGDCVWDNRMNTSATANKSVDDYLLCFESENSLHAIQNFVDDGYFCALDDGEGRGASTTESKTDKYDIAVGRFPVSTADAAKIMVDKTISYMNKENSGAWQNVAMFLGDDGNNNVHMQATDEAAGIVEKLAPGLQVKRVLWDMYPRVTSATGSTYPEIAALVKKQQNEGALLFNYCGHGRADQMSGENVLRYNDFADFRNKGLSFWITASCDIMPYDGTVNNIGETAVLNPSGGAVAFYGTTRTVYTNYNKHLDDAYLTALFTKVDGKYISVGEAQRVAKNKLVMPGSGSGSDNTINKLQYALLGDPALVLNIPTDSIIIDSINGVAIADAAELPQIKAGSKAVIKGHVVSSASENGVNASFNGIVNITVKDAKEKMAGRMNDTSDEGTNKSYVYYDHIKTIFSGSDSIRSGRFSVPFAVTKDINYSDAKGLITAFGISSDGKTTANGSSDSFIVGGSEELSTDSFGPSVYCYLNSPGFTNGDDVNPTPYFVAEISDEDGLNTSGNGIGHDLQLVIDEDPMKTYKLNDNFSFEFGSYTKGTTFYNIPELEEGPHVLKFTAWDIMNNPSVSTLKFNVVRGLTPRMTKVYCTNNPARTSTTFIVAHDRSGSNVDVCIEVFDSSGRLLWKHNDVGATSGITYTYTWDLCTGGGGKLQSGIYLYRVRLSSDGSSEVSKAKKLIVLD